MTTLQKYDPATLDCHGRTALAQSSASRALLVVVLGAALFAFRRRDVT